MARGMSGGGAAPIRSSHRLRHDRCLAPGSSGQTHHSRRCRCCRCRTVQMHTTCRQLTRAAEQFVREGVAHRVESTTIGSTTWGGNKVPPFARYYVQMSTVMPRFGVRQRTPIPARHLPSVLPEMIVQTLARAKAELAAPFEGLTTDGRVVPGLFPLRSTGVS